jgi:hypothetical protein
MTGVMLRIMKTEITIWVCARIITRALVVAIAFIASMCAVACAVPAAQSDSLLVSFAPGEIVPEALSQNGLSQNDFLENGLSEAALSRNGLSKNGLGQAPLEDASLLKNAAFVGWFDTDRDGANDVMTYVARCALPFGAGLAHVARNGRRFEWRGSLGLAPLWRKAPIERHEQEVVSACLMAHVNARGRHIEFSLRGIEPSLVVATTGTEVRRFARREGAFYGNVFTESELHVCSENATLQSLLYGPNGRVCTSPGNCGFQWDGDCDDVCQRKEIGAEGNKALTYGVFTRCGSFESVVTTYLTL